MFVCKDAWGANSVTANISLCGGNGVYSVYASGSWCVNYKWFGIPQTLSQHSIFLNSTLFAEQPFCVLHFRHTRKKESKYVPAWGDNDTLLIKATGKRLQIPKSIHGDKKCVADVIHIQLDNTHVSNQWTGQNIVDYWTHLMLKTNTSYFTGSSQLNKRFFFFVFVTPSEIYIHMAAYRQFLSFEFLSVTSNWQTVCITLCMSPLLAWALKGTGGAFLGGTLEKAIASISSIHHWVSMFAVKIGTVCFALQGSYTDAPK